MVWLFFALCTVAIAVAGPVLARASDRIAEALALSRSWIGIILLATATSLPELVTGVSAVTLADAPNIAVGDALGSCIFNLVLLALLDFLSRSDPLFDRADQGHILTAALGVMLIGLVGIVLVVGRDALDLRLLHMSIYSPLLILLYFVSIRATFLHDRKLAPRTAPQENRRSALRGPVQSYILAALPIVLAGSALPFIGQGIAELMGWRTSFVGTMLIAAATSLPELVVVIAALRLGSADMAIAGLLGSNLFNMLVLAIDDLAYRKGSLLADASPVHAASAFAAVVMSGIVIVAIIDRPKVRFFGVTGWIGIALLTVYLGSAYAMFLIGE
ncbi:sodium:calcium antiporter [Stakelama marina]|uniref:Sodium:calcium antiporter n=1 Tax=Stakelama marina TaxID=2826939 RepID=A0A8T4IGD2_9SPHN|nr:sodium:calcium antiporter [Stakelama marina]MBR0551286.1 sodium:calcium antiporter [Stakelama marina]